MNRSAPVAPLVSAADSGNINGRSGKKRAKDPAEDHDHGKSRVRLNRAEQKHF
jgi:hypothetical protein